jgi:exosortase/archaeosortase family protein
MLLKLLVAFHIIFELPWGKTLKLGGISVALAFGLNGIRLCLLALLVANHNQTGFAYWHDGEGVQIIISIAVLLFGFIVYQFFEKKSIQC